MEHIGLIAGIGSIMTLIGFVAVFVKIGVDKGDTSRRLSEVEKDIKNHSEKFVILEQEVHGIEKENAAFMSKMATSFEFIKESLARLEKKFEGEK